MSFWDSKAGQEALVLVGLQIVAFFAINPFLISLADWRNTVTEEADALMHASVQTMMHLKSVVTLILLIVINVITFGCLIACLDTAATNDAGMWVSMLFDSASLTLPFICFGLYSKLPLQIVQILASLPFPLHDLLQHHLLARRRRPRRQGAALPIRALLPVVPRAWRAQPDGGLPRRRHARRLHHRQRLPGHGALHHLPDRARLRRQAGRRVQDQEDQGGD